MSPKPKLELTWIGKDDQPVLESRILIEDPAKSYGDPNSENMLIYGDNLLALKAFEQDFAGKKLKHPFERRNNHVLFCLWLQYGYKRFKEMVH